MPDQPTFVVNDRRKFTSEGELRHDSPAAPAAPTETAAPVDSNLQAAETAPADGPQLVTAPFSSVSAEAELADFPESGLVGDPYSGPEASFDPETQDASLEDMDQSAMPAGPTEEQIAEATRAYEATVDRLETAMRAANPGGERIPPMSFERLVQSLYTQALILLGGGAQPGETPRVDILGARETIDMLSILAAKAKGNLSPAEDNLLQSALFDLRMGFLEITQALARQAAQRQGSSAPGALGGMPPMGSGPRIVR